MNVWLKIGTSLLLIGYAARMAAKSLVVSVQSWKFSGLDLTNGTVALTLNFAIKNPLIIGLTLKGVQGDVYIQGEKAGYINTAIDYYLSGGRTHIVPVIVNISLAGALQGLVANIQTGDVRTLEIAFDGKIYVGSYNLGIPVQIDLDYNDLTK